MAGVGIIFFITLVLVLGSSLDTCSAQCYNTKWNKTKEECKDGYSEIYKNQVKSTGQWLTMCCKTGSADEKSQRLYADQCEATQCFPTYAASYNLCDMGRPLSLFIDGKEVEFEETVRGPCKGVYDNNEQIGISVLCCAKNSTETLITTLYGTEPLEFPHWARLGKIGCGGTLYNEKWVLTAAHCVIDSQTHKVYTKEDPEWDDHVGSVSINIDMEKEYTKNFYKVKSITVHPNTSHLHPPDEYHTSYYDVALLELEEEVQFNENVKALKIPDKGYDPLKYGDYAVIIGFGTTDTLRLSRKLQKANLKIRKKSDTFNKDTSLSYMEKYKDQLLPLGGIMDGKANPLAGTGDSGGPSICRDKDGYALLCGITSFTIPNELCLTNLDQRNCMPAVYNDVQFFSDWIKSIAGEQKEEQLMKTKLYGYEAGEKDYLSQVHITSTDGTKCGGTLVVGSDLVLTAGHCAVDDNGWNRKGLKVAGGVRDLDDEPVEVVGVKTTADLPGFERMMKDKKKKSVRKKRVISLVLETWKAGKDTKPPLIDSPYYRNDLAILKLNKPLSSSKPAKIGSISAFNRIAYEVSLPKPNDYSQKLQVREFKMLSLPDCQKRVDRLSALGYNVTLEDNVLCGVESYSGGSLCDRESGGGLFCDKDDEKVLCGVQAFRMCEFNVPNVFVDIRANMDWISNAIETLKDA